MRIYLILASIFLCSYCTNKEQLPEAKISLLILSGSNNHDWEATTRQLQRMYLESEKFDVAITESPDTLNYDHFDKFDAIVSNWTAWPKHDIRWPKAAEEGLMNFIKEGGGFVLFHAASSTLYDWAPYQQLVGSSWGDSTKHGKITPHKVVFKDKDHPITKGISDFWITDELWVNSQTHTDLNILAEAYSDPENKGRGKMEPVVTWNTLGKGRSFHNILGHDVRAMKNTGWRTLMLRGTEWAATGKVSIPVPASLSREKPIKSMNYSWAETDTTFALLNNNEIIWQYNFNTIKGKPFFHPVNINNSIITWLSPEDHPWHLGLWHSWKFINGVNYWEYDQSKDVAPFNFIGITELRNISMEKGDDFSCTIKLDLAYHKKNSPDLLLERRIVTVSSPGEKGLFYLDYNFELSAVADAVELNRTPLPHEKNGKDYGGYAGLSIRFSQDLFGPSFINSDGSTDMKHGEPMPWKYYGLRNNQGDKIGAAIFGHVKNLNYPEPWFMTDNENHPFYYFSPAPIFNQPHLMKKGDELKLKYRIQFYPGVVGKEVLDKDYENYLMQ